MVGLKGERSPEFWEDDAGVGKVMIRECRLCKRGLADQWWREEIERWRVMVEGTKKTGEVV